MMPPVGSEGRRDTPQRPDGCIGVPTFQTRDGGFARSDFAGQPRLRETESTPPLGHFHPDPEGFALPFVENPKLRILKLLS
jgi:hypothetical protein